ncbi:ribosomal L7Ae/L30e/S12e/Gadd45 family protein [Pseudogracilibacillus sp. SO10305]|uniref:ribosomal L7Ae/L30e/S12e/Gadd45 family protein n=1 Tax=Pseudogracilibacillus sp. SO10305 TaxID=3098292 RepID=UPI00300E1CCC
MAYERITQLHSKLIIGTKQTIKAMNNGEVSELFVATDAAEHITNKVINVARKNNIVYTMVDSKATLGKACEIDVDASVVAIKRT